MTKKTNNPNKTIITEDGWQPVTNGFQPTVNPAPSGNLTRNPAPTKIPPPPPPKKE